MPHRMLHFTVAAIAYCVMYAISSKFLVFPGTPTALTVFVPFLAGLMWGNMGVLGISFGYLLVNFMGVDWREFITMTVTAYLPYKLWHTCFVVPGQPRFAYSVRTLFKFITISFVTFGLTALFIGFAARTDELALMFATNDINSHTPWQRAGLIFLNAFDITLLFGLPLFFIFISYGFKFYVPPSSAPAEAVADGEPDSANRRALVALYVFFVALFVILDASGLIFDLDQMYTWFTFNAEEITMMDLTLIVVMYIVLKYRRSIVTNFIFLVVTAIFIASFMLSSIGFLTISSTIDDNIQNDLEKMSVIYRERMVHTFSNMINTTKNIDNIATSEITDYYRLETDPVHRRQFLATVERHAATLAKSVPGNVAFYVVMSPELGNDGFLCYRHVSDWGRKLPDYVKRESIAHLDNKYKAMAETKLAKLSEPYWSERTDGYVVSYVLPIIYGDKSVGIVGLDMDFNYLVHDVKRMSVYEQGFIRLMDKNGDILYTNEKKSKSGERKEIFYETETYLSNGIWLRIGSSARENFAERNFMLMKVVVATLLITVLVTFFSLWLAKKATLPIKSVAEAARKVADGDLNVKIFYPTQNELGILVQTITEMVAKLEIHVYRDKLTGLLNVAAYTRKVKLLEQKHNESAAATPYAIAVFDANFLKRINDTYGHEAGNELIIRVAKTIGRVFKGCPAYRIGGDEFVAILEESAYGERERLLYEFDRAIEAEYFMAGKNKIAVSVARGMAAGNTKQEYSTVFKQADTAMYAHKTAIKAELGLSADSR